MRSGLLDDRIEIFSITESRDDVGGLVDSETLVGTVWGSVGSPSAFSVGSESLRSGRVSSMHLHKIEIRWFPGLTEKHTLKFRGKTVNILAINESQRREKLTILGEEKESVGVES